LRTLAQATPLTLEIAQLAEFVRPRWRMPILVERGVRVSRRKDDSLSRRLAKGFVRRSADARYLTVLDGDLGGVELVRRAGRAEERQRWFPIDVGIIGPVAAPAACT